VVWSENQDWVDDLVKVYKEGTTHPISIRKKLGWDLSAKKISAKIANLVKEGTITRPSRKYQPILS
jgi:hypothetical protein